VPVPCFCYFCVSKAPQEIFSKLDETKARVPIFSRHETKSEDETEGDQGPGAP
jgi:hypothetical protein